MSGSVVLDKGTVVIIMSLFLLHWVTQVITYMKYCIGLMQLPNTKTETIFVAIQDILIRVICQLPIVEAWGCNTFTKNHASHWMDHQALFHIEHSDILKSYSLKELHFFLHI